jgi:uncharacterized protein with NAD-binding domain and iron-sulfur cluster
MPGQGRQGEGITRRRFVHDAGVAAVAAAGLADAPAVAARPKRRRGRKQTVAVFGGGIAGLTAAHELVERGFDVTVYERRAWGGKARSTEVPGTGRGGRRDLPGEHAFRVPFGCYQNLPDTMRRTPYGTNPNGVFDNLVGLPDALLAFERAHDIVLPLDLRAPSAGTPVQVIDTIQALLVDLGLPPDAAAYLVQRLAVFFSSCDARRLAQWEQMTWSDFIGATRYAQHAVYRFINEFPRVAQASKATETSAKYVGWVLEIWIVYSLLGRGTNGPTIRILDLPTNEAWIDPWCRHLRELGVRLRLGSLERFVHRDGRIIGAHVRTANARRAVVTADWHVCALPVERARRFWTPSMLAADPMLAGMRGLRTDWMNGIMFYLRERASFGAIGCFDTLWGLAGIAQAGFWSGDFAARYGDGTVKDKLSVAIPDWHTPGVLYGKPARECSPDEVARDTWEQLKRSLNNPGETPLLTDDMLHSYDIDPGMLRRGGRLISQDPLVLPTAGTEHFRPGPATAIRNLTLCGDYLDGEWEVANMEAACFNGRRAANAILDRSRSREAMVAAIKPYRPREWEPLKRLDEDRWRDGQRNLFDTDLSPDAIKQLLGGATRT